MQTCPIGQDRGPALLLQWPPLYDFDIKIEVRGDAINADFIPTMRGFAGVA